MCDSCRLHRDASTFVDYRVASGAFQKFEGVPHRREWISQFVREHCQESVFASIGGPQGLFRSLLCVDVDYNSDPAVRFTISSNVRVTEFIQRRPMV